MVPQREVLFQNALTSLLPSKIKIYCYYTSHLIIQVHFPQREHEKVKKGYKS